MRATPPCPDRAVSAAKADAFQRSGAVRCDKVFEVDSPAEHVAFIDHEKGRDVVVFARLTYQCIHSLLYRHILADDHAVGSHAAAYLAVVKRRDEPKLGAYDFGNIAAVLIVEPVHHSLRRIVSTDDSRYLIERGDVFEFSILHWFVLRFILLT